MLKSLIFWLAKLCFSGFLWVFVLSVRWDGQTLFDRAHHYLVDNRIISNLEVEVSYVLDDVISGIQARYAALRSDVDDQTSGPY